jgi:hypothetical protein
LGGCSNQDVHEVVQLAPEEGRVDEVRGEPAEGPGRRAAAAPAAGEHQQREAAQGQPEAAHACAEHRDFYRP